MNNDEILDNVKKLIESGELGNIPDLRGNINEVADKIVNDKEKFATLLCLLAPCIDSKYIRIFGELASISIKYKRKKKAYLPNILLDILYYLKMIRYISIKEEEIIAEILDRDFANEMNILKSQLLKEKPELDINKYYESLEKLKGALNGK